MGYPVKVTYKKSSKKSSKKYTKNYSCKVTVKNSSISAPATAEVVEGATVSVKATAKPASAKVAYVSDNTEVATVDANGVVTGVKAGTAKITATATCGTVKKTAETTVTVKAAVAQLTAVKQTASNAFVATFSATTPQYTKDDITVKATDGTAELPVKSVEYAANGTEAVVTLLTPFTDAKEYTIACKDATVSLTAKVGAVASIGFKTASAQQNVATPIEFVLLDKDGIDVTPSVSLDTTCVVSIEGSYSSAEIDKASKATITMSNVGDTADVTVTYSTNEKDVQDVTATQKITCVKAEAVKGTGLFAQAGKAGTLHVLGDGSCAKFYAGVKATDVSVAKGNDDDVYFCAEKDEYEAVNYDSYEFESANEAIATVNVKTDAGKYAVISVTGNEKGSTQINVKATKNGATTFYTIPVVVTNPLEAVKMTVTIDTPTMSNVDDSAYFGTVEAKLFDSEGTDVTGHGTFEFDVTTSNYETDGFEYDPDGNKAYVFAANAKAKTYTVKVTGADTTYGTGKTFVKSVNVTVKNLPVKKDNGTSNPLALTYQIKMSRNVLDQNPNDTGDDSLEAKLYATYNGLFAGYVRSESDGTIKVAEGHVTPTDATKLSDVTVGAKFGTKKFAQSLYGTAVGDYETLYNAIGSTTGCAITFDSVISGNTAKVYTPDGSATLAKEGNYTLEYKYTMNGKHASKTNVFTVKNSMAKPKVAVVTRTVDTLDAQTIVKDGLKTNVDMNNNNVESSNAFKATLVSKIVSPSDIDGNLNAGFEESSDNKGNMFVKYAIVEDNYSNGTWYFFMPVNTTFKTE